MTTKIQPIKSLDELQQGDVVEVKGIIGDGPYVVEAIGDVPQHEREVVLHPIHCPECPDSQISYLRRNLSDSLIKNSGRISLTRLNKADYAGWKYAGIRMVE